MLAGAKSEAALKKFTPQFRRFTSQIQRVASKYLLACVIRFTLFAA